MLEGVYSFCALCVRKALTKDRIEPHLPQSAVELETGSENGETLLCALSLSYLFL